MLGTPQRDCSASAKTALENSISQRQFGGSEMISRMTKVVKKGNAGFSLIELMVAVGIVGILSAIALPKYQTFQAKAKGAEAQNTLGYIYTLEQAYFVDNNSFNTIATVGFVLPNNAKYGYAGGVAGAATFTATAAAGAGIICTGLADSWTITETDALTHVPNGCVY